MPYRGRLAGIKSQFCHLLHRRPGIPGFNVHSNFSSPNSDRSEICGMGEIEVHPSNLRIKPGLAISSSLKPQAVGRALQFLSEAHPQKRSGPHPPITVLLKVKARCPHMFVLAE